MLLGMRRSRRLTKLPPALREIPPNNPLSPKQAVSILRNAGYEQSAIAAMTAEQQADAVQEAISYGIHLSSLPTDSKDRITRLIYLHESTGRRLTFSEAIKQMKECRVQSETVVLSLSFDEAVQRLLDDKTLDPEDREHLEGLRTDFRIHEHWKVIEKTPEVSTNKATPGDLIWQVLVGRRVARFIGEFPAREEQARNAEKLAGFLRRTGEVKESDCRLLDDLASRLREPEDYRFLHVGSIPVSRKSRNTSAGKATKNSREVKAFINWMVGYMKATYGRPFNEVVATLTDVTFPGRETTLDQVRAAVKVSTDKGRARK